MKITKKDKKEFIDEIKKFINNLMFEDISTVLSKTYRWLKDREDIDGFGVDVDLKKSIVNAIVRFPDKDSIAFTIFESK